MKGRSITLLLAIGSVLAILLAACSGVVEKETNMISGQIPPIDTYQPSRVETASFALG